MKELLEKILGQIKKTPSGVRAYEDLYHICLETQKGSLSVYANGGGTNEVVEMTITIAPSTVISMDAE